RGNMRSSSWSNLESSAFIRHGGTKRGTVAVGKGSGTAEGIARGEEATYHASVVGEGQETQRRPLPLSHPHPGFKIRSFPFAKKRNFLPCLDTGYMSLSQFRIQGWGLICAVHDLAAHNRRDDFACELPAIKRCVAGF